jgi:hypothetical protein
MEPRIRQQAVSVQQRLENHLAHGENEEVLRILRALKYFEKFPPSLNGGPLPEWRDCMDEEHGGANMPIELDLGSEQEGEELQPIDVERFVLEVLVTKVVKTEPV